MGTREDFCTYVLSLRVDYLFTLSVCFLSIVPLEKLFDYGGEQLAMYCGDDLGDLIVITLNKSARVSR
jgi:Ca2+:H+ antiporter